MPPDRMSCRRESPRVTRTMVGINDRADHPSGRIDAIPDGACHAFRVFHLRAGLAKRGGQTEPRPHNVIEIQGAVISSCQREQDLQVWDVLAVVREATVGFELAIYPVSTKP